MGDDETSKLHLDTRRRSDAARACGEGPSRGRRRAQIKAVGKQQKNARSVSEHLRQAKTPRPVSVRRCSAGVLAVAIKRHSAMRNVVFDKASAPARHSGSALHLTNAHPTFRVSCKTTKGARLPSAPGSLPFRHSRPVNPDLNSRPTNPPRANLKRGDDANYLNADGTGKPASPLMGCSYVLATTFQTPRRTPSPEERRGVFLNGHADDEPGPLDRPSAGGAAAQSSARCLHRQGHRRVGPVA